MDYLSSDEGLAQLVAAFEAGELLENQWHHKEHLAVCYWYLSTQTELEAIYRIKLGILKYNEKYAIAQTEQRGYHETITLFFVKFVQRHLLRNPAKAGSVTEGLKVFLAENSDFLPTLWRYYSRPLLNSPRARIHWVEPDLRKFE